MLQYYYMLFLHYVGYRSFKYIPFTLLLALLHKRNRPRSDYGIRKILTVVYLLLWNQAVPNIRRAKDFYSNGTSDRFT